MGVLPQDGVTSILEHAQRGQSGCLNLSSFLRLYLHRGDGHAEKLPKSIGNVGVSLSVLKSNEGAIGFFWDSNLNKIGIFHFFLLVTWGGKYHTD